MGGDDNEGGTGERVGRMGGGWEALSVGMRGRELTFSSRSLCCRNSCMTYESSKALSPGEQTNTHANGP